MIDLFDLFEQMARRTHLVDEVSDEVPTSDHPFEVRNIHPGLPRTVRTLFDSGHYAQATFEAFKFLEKEVRRHANIRQSGKRLMMLALSENRPKIRLTPLTDQSEIDEQEGYKFLFAGGIVAIRNPRGHEYNIVDDVDTCLDHVTFVSMLLRKLADAGYHVRRMT